MIFILCEFWTMVTSTVLYVILTSRLHAARNPITIPPRIPAFLHLYFFCTFFNATTMRVLRLNHANLFPQLFRTTPSQPWPSIGPFALSKQGRGKAGVSKQRFTSPTLTPLREPLSAPMMMHNHCLPNPWYDYNNNYNGNGGVYN